MPGKAITYKKEFEAITKRVETMATKTYKEAYKDADKTKYPSEAEFIQAAKQYNEKKYGTTEPTKTAKEKGVSKEELAKKNTERKAREKEMSDTLSKEVKQKADSRLGINQPMGEVKPVKIETKEDKAKNLAKAGDKKAGESAGLEGKAKRKFNKAGKAQMKADKAKKKTEDALKKVSDRQKEGKSVEDAQARTKRLNEKRKRKEKKAGEKMEKAEDSIATRYGGGGESPVAYFRQKIKYNNSAKDIAIRVAADEKDKKHASKAGKKRLDKDISSMISNASMKTNTMRYDSMAEKMHGMPKMKTNQAGGGYAAKNPSAPGKQLKKLGSILSKFMHKTK